MKAHSISWPWCSCVCCCSAVRWKADALSAIGGAQGGALLLLQRYSRQQRHLDTEARAESHRQARTWHATAPQALEDE